MNISRTFIDYPSAYSSFEEIPKDKRLQTYEEEYIGRDIWADFFEEFYLNEGYGEKLLTKVARRADRWKKFCDTYATHHAFVTPQIVNDWIKELLSKINKQTAKNSYLSTINRFYRYLLWNVEYPHSYNPVQFAVRTLEPAKIVWGENHGR